VTRKKSANKVRKTKHISIDRDLEKNKAHIRKILGDSPDTSWGEVTLHNRKSEKIHILILSIGGLADEASIHQNILEPLRKQSKVADNIIEGVKEKIYINEVKYEANLYNAILKTLRGNTFILIEGYTTGIIASTEGKETRSIEEPPTEAVVSGSRESFIESVHTNISLLRQRIASPQLRFQLYTFGEYSQTEVVLAYVEGIVDPQVLERVNKRIRKIEVDDIASSGQIEQYLEDQTYTIFPVTGNTERPDVAAAMLMEGRVVLIVDGTPITLFYPSLFLEKMQDVEDYSSRPFSSSVVRLLRLFAFVISTMLPALYICIVNFHKEAIPSGFLLALEKSREGVPLPLVQETLLLIVLFEIVREAGVRMPRAIGQAVSIVGALILGEVSVAAGLISAQTIIVVSTAAITAFIVTPVAEVVSLLRIIYIIPSATFGFYGLMVSVLFTIMHMANLKSMGVYYMAPIMPLYFRDWKDAFIRLPYRLLKYRPKSIPNVRPIRYKRVPPSPNKGNEKHDKNN